LIAVMSGLNAGVVSRISRYLGENKKKQAENTAMHGVLFSFVASLIISVLGLIFIKPLFMLLGAKGDVLMYSIHYMSIIFMGAVFLFLTFTLFAIFNGQGNTKTPMKIEIAILLLNIILDPLFIYYFGFGVRGAAIATVITFFVGLVLALLSLKKHSYLELSFKSFRFDMRILKEIFSIGSSATLMMLLMSFYSAVFNRVMVIFGTEHVATLGVAFRLESVIVMPIVAVSLSLLTLAGMYHGAKRKDLVLYITNYGTKISALFALIMGIVFFAVPSLFLRIFTSDATIISLGVPFIRIDVLALPFFAVMLIYGRVLQGMGYGLPSLITTLIRVIFVGIPLSLIFVFVLGYGYLSIAVALVIATVVAAGVAWLWLWLKFRKLSTS